MTTTIKPSHPGEILREEFMKPLGLTAYRLAKELHVTAPRMNEVVRGRRAITPDMALRLSRYFTMSDEFWVNLQADYDMRIARRKNQKALLQIEPRASAG